MIQKGNIIENIPITGISNEGKAIGRHDNFVIFTDDAVPGDLVDVLIYKKKKNFAEGRAINIRKPSVSRTKPFCEHFGTCGGCKWQHLSYERQLEFKQQQVFDAFQRIGKLDMPEMLPIKGAGDTIHYRNKLEFTFSDKAWLTKDELHSVSTDLLPALGFHVPFRFDKVLDIKKCYLQDDFSNTIRLEVKNFCTQNGIEFFNLKSQHGEIRNLIIRNTLHGEWMVIVVFHTISEEKRNALLDHLVKKLPQISSLSYILNTKKNDTIGDQEVILYSGREYITETMENIRFRISPKSFFQTNSKQAYELYKLVREFAAFTGRENVYDLYTGTGTIACFIAGNVNHVTGIDYVEESIKDARQNSLDNNILNTSFYSGDIKDTLTEDFINKHGRPDVIITDPPRAGMHEDVVRAMINASPEKIVYVSCNPVTQARDLQLLDENYRIEKIQPVDMFPHTSHVENVTLLHKK